VNGVRAPRPEYVAYLNQRIETLSDQVDQMSRWVPPSHLSNRGVLRWLIKQVTAYAYVNDFTIGQLKWAVGDVWRELVPRRHAPGGNRRVPVTPATRRLVLSRDSFTCCVCGHTDGSGSTLHVDHRVPVALGGRHALTNLWTLCAPCNLSKGARTLEAFLADREATT
jgi:hypothetical protein